MEIKISQDIRKFKTKDIAMFSLKEAGFIAGALIIGYVAHFMLKLSLEITGLCMIPVLAIGFVKPFGLSLPKFLGIISKDLLEPREFGYGSDFVYDLEDDTVRELYGEDYVISEERLTKYADVWYAKPDYTDVPKVKYSKDELRFISQMEIDKISKK